MTFDPDTIHLASRHLMGAGFVCATLATLYRKSWGFSAISALCLAETYALKRFAFHVWARIAMLGSTEQPGAKEALQSNLMYVVTMIGIAALAILFPMLKREGNGRRLMYAGILIILALFAVEMVSPHQIDKFIYHPEGPFARNAIIYFIAAAMIACGSLLTRQRH